MIDDAIATTSYGFTWGPVEVSRACSHERVGYVVLITTEHETLEVRVSPAGRKIETRSHRPGWRLPHHVQE